MKTITFTNGKTMEIKDGDANTLRDNILKGAGKFQCFSDENELMFMINLEEVTCIE
jgi:hypothetical protein|tara:strand:+ start:564 stop:731 length:168 start_codon:yes stop_codon:yes gene_type:complete